MQDHQTHDNGDNRSAHDNSSLSHGLHELQAKVAKLEAALMQSHQAAATSDPAAMKMGGMQGGSMTSMGMMDRGMTGGQMGMMPGMRTMQTGQEMSGMGMGGMSNMPMMGGMSGQGMSGMSMMENGGMSMMGQMRGMGQMQMPSALPGFPGASHIYHVGATNFFLDHSQHITLSQEQQAKLNQIKEQTLLAQASFDRSIAEAEQELWVLTSAEAPDAEKIEAKVREAEKIGGDKRIAYIRAVGEAAKVLTNEQRQALVGMLPPDHVSAGASHQH